MKSDFSLQRVEMSKREHVLFVDTKIKRVFALAQSV